MSSFSPQRQLRIYEPPVIYPDSSAHRCLIQYPYEGILEDSSPLKPSLNLTILWVKYCALKVIYLFQGLCEGTGKRE